ncbi:amino acid--tRNA ligase-related protein [Brevundimonas sp.]|uniref:amino acid--tRNA ligase-related protein n=1 Tax=Brevundimonas sp. TaxID=1871086 RepID=UPI003F727590
MVTRVEDLLLARHRIFQAIRSDLIESGHLEVTTPFITPYPEICPTYQFATSHPELGQPGYLRIAPTEFLKRLVVRGAQRIFEFSTNVRVEKVDETHLPEFISLEVMSAGSTVVDMANLTERLVRIALDHGVPESNRAYQPPGSSRPYQLAEPWPRLALPELFRDRFGAQREDLFDSSRLAEFSRSLGLIPNVAADCADLMDDLVTKLTTEFDTPVFVGEYPRYLGGPAKPTLDPRFKERTELFVGGLELANMSSTLTDAAALRTWHVEMYELKNARGIQTNCLDEPLLLEVENGLPPSAVLGLGLERAIMVSLGVSDIRKVKPFNWHDLYPV